MDFGAGLFFFMRSFFYALNGNTNGNTCQEYSGLNPVAKSLTALATHGLMIYSIQVAAAIQIYRGFGANHSGATATSDKDKL